MRQRIFTTGLAAIAAGAIMLALGSPAWAEPIVFTASGTITAADSGMGYTVGQTVSYQWTLNSNFTKPGSSNFSTFVNWNEENVPDPPLWTNVQGTGIAGTFQQAPNNGPNNNLSAYDSGGIWVRLNTDSASATKNHGIYLAANPDYFIVRVNLGIFDSPLTAPGFTGFAIPASGPLPKPNDYFADYLGTYSMSFTPGPFDLPDISARNSSGSFLGAKVAWNSMTIAPVPEPSTWLLAAGGLGGAAWVAARRRTR